MRAFLELLLGTRRWGFRRYFIPVMEEIFFIPNRSTINFVMMDQLFELELSRLFGFRREQNFRCDHKKKEEKFNKKLVMKKKLQPTKRMSFFGDREKLYITPRSSSRENSLNN